MICKKRGAENYGHFLVEMLPRAFLARAHLSAGNLCYVTPAPAGALGNVITTAFAMIGIEEERLIRSGLEPGFFREVFVVDGLTRHGSYMSPRVLDCLDHLGAQIPAVDEERIYVSRKTAHYRKLRNEDALAPVFRRNGYRVVDPGTLSLTDQIAIFKGARHVVGVDGAGMTNICFSAPGASVTCLTPGTMPETFYWFLCAHKRHRFRDVRLPEIGGEPPGFSPWCGDIMIDEDELEAILAPGSRRLPQGASDRRRYR